jgi:hypothetical protein
MGSFTIENYQVGEETSIQWLALKLAEECSELASELITVATKTPEKLDKKSLSQEMGQVLNLIWQLKEHPHAEEVLDRTEVSVSYRKTGIKLTKKFDKYEYTPATHKRKDPNI